MRYFLITDEADSLTGLRLAGIEGVLVESSTDCIRKIEQAVRDQGIAVLIISETLAALCPEQMEQLRQNNTPPLVVEIPGKKIGRGIHGCNHA